MRPFTFRFWAILAVVQGLSIGCGGGGGDGGTTSSPSVPNLSGTMFDAHLHGGSSTWTDAEVIAKIQSAGFPQAFFFSTGTDSPTPASHFYGFLSVSVALLKQDDSSWSSTKNWLSTKLAQGFRGFGEIAIRHNPDPSTGYPVDGKHALDLLELAGAYGVPVTMHVESGYTSATAPPITTQYTIELESALNQRPATVVIWAHAGDAPPSKIRQMIENHANLYVDLSCRNDLFYRSFDSYGLQSMADPSGILYSEWKQLLEDHYDRFMVGSDVGGHNDSRIAMIDDVVAYYRNVLDQLSPAAAEAIGHQNAEYLLSLRK